jgi:hypothetical protein
MTSRLYKDSLLTATAGPRLRCFFNPESQCRGDYGFENYSFSRAAGMAENAAQE